MIDKLIEMFSKIRNDNQKVIIGRKLTHSLFYSLQNGEYLVSLRGATYYLKVIKKAKNKTYWIEHNNVQTRLCHNVKSLVILSKMNINVNLKRAIFHR